LFSFQKPRIIPFARESIRIPWRSARRNLAVPFEKLQTHNRRRARYALALAGIGPFANRNNAFFL
jgi:ABC-type nitrate/sulfonate/bicarbonate transport system ATPase subunit